MTPAARVQAAIAILDDILAGAGAEHALTGWARRARFAGSKDRAAIRDHVFDALRCRRSFAALGGGHTGRALMLGAARDQGWDISSLFDGSRYGPAPVAATETGRAPEPGAEAGDIPDWLWPEFQRSAGSQAAVAAAYLRARAPVYLRVNTRKTDPATLTDLLAPDGVVVVPVANVPDALRVVEGARKLRNLKAFADGFFEFQDAASQEVVAQLPIRPGTRILDYCAGGGGKTLAIAARADVDVTASDIDLNRMRDLPSRAKRANARIQICPQDALPQGFDLVLCDVPCSGSGAWRRSPAGKWSLTRHKLDALIETQSAILNSAAELVTKTGMLAYVTCSVFQTENEDQISHFLHRRDEWQIAQQCRWPLSGGPDGFFLAVLERV